MSFGVSSKDEILKSCEEIISKQVDVSNSFKVKHLSLLGKGGFALEFVTMVSCSEPSLLAVTEIGKSSYRNNVTSRLAAMD